MSIVKTDHISEHTTSAGVTADVLLTASAGLKLDALTLANYSEGSWTPSLQGTGTAGVVTYTTQVGRYTRIGSLVIATCYLNVSGISGSPTGAAVIAGLPFSCRNIVGSYQAASIGELDRITLSAGFNQVTAYVAPGTTQIGLIQNGSAVAGASLPIGNMGTTPGIILNLLYQV